MTSSDILNEIKRIAKEVLPKGGQLILYGSRARNEATEDSDWAHGREMKPRKIPTGTCSFF